MKDFLEKVNKLEDGEIFGVSVDEVVDALEADGWTRGELETNGWDWDYWIDFCKGENKIEIFGSGYYGKSVKVHKLEDE